MHTCVHSVEKLLWNCWEQTDNINPLTILQHRTSQMQQIHKNGKLCFTEYIIKSSIISHDNMVLKNSNTFFLIHLRFFFYYFYYHHHQLLTMAHQWTDGNVIIQAYIISVQIFIKSQMHKNTTQQYKTLTKRTANHHYACFILLYFIRFSIRCKLF